MKFCRFTVADHEAIRGGRDQLDEEEFFVIPSPNVDRARRRKSAAISNLLKILDSLTPGIEVNNGEAG